MTPSDDDDLTILSCWGCGGAGDRCRKCAGTGRVFWVEGRAYPYTPDGEKRAMRALGRAS